jgi:hypothetical protein
MTLSTSSPSVNDLFWLAGFLEGEGYFGCSKACVVTACQVQRQPLEECQRIAGGRIYFQERHIKWPTRCDVYHWVVNGKAAVGVMMTLYKILSPRRREQVRVALAIWGRMPPRGIHRRQCPNGHTYTAASLIRVSGPKPHRKCKECHRQQAVRKRAALATRRRHIDDPSQIPLVSA